MFRPEIEGLRAVAASLVAVWHIWVGGVSGGVDVFFVVSGLLITTTLIGQIDRYGRVRPFAFLGRLLRRLLPSALVVLSASLVGTWLLVPEALRERSFAEIFASALYFENWQLAFAAVDYLDSEDPHTPVQHFWAMSVQGQFYVIWLAVFAAAILLARKSSRSRAWAAGLTAVLLVGSLAYSVWFTAVNQPFAYFSTFTRAWEFALGALAAFVIGHRALRGTWSWILGWVGLTAIVLCGVVLPVGSSFPGAAALWPTVAALLVLFSGGDRERPGHAAWLLSRRPVVWLGGLAYGIYLWHWPLLIFYRHLNGRDEVGIIPGVGIIVTSVLLAWATTALIERPLRRLGERTTRTRLIAAAALVAVAVTVAGTSVWSRHQSYADAEARHEAILADLEQREGAHECFGARAILAGLDACADDADPERLLPIRSRLLDDVGRAYWCYTSADATRIDHCSVGSDRPDALRIALVGNSHAAMFYDALYDHLGELNWRLDTFVGNGCVWGEAVSSELCEGRVDEMNAHLLEGEPYDVLITTTGRGDREFSQERVDEYLESWEEIEARGTQVVVVTDNPRLPDEAADCVMAASARDLVAGECDFSSEDGYRSPDMMLEAAEQSRGDHDIVDLRDLYCADDRCPVVVGNVIVYRDQHHLTATYIRTVAPVLVERLTEVLDR
ncbi:acyltransferase [Microbacterium album]|uniref:Acyltransferase n=1 Tax=Microbacterium album TaxID=2053191 RepID=A0A917IDI1_9MICO|nr:acyltransferase [Microbacterium album]